MLNNGSLVVPEIAVSKIFLQGLYRCHVFAKVRFSVGSFE